MSSIAVQGELRHVCVLCVRYAARGKTGSFWQDGWNYGNLHSENARVSDPNEATSGRY